MTTPTFDNNAFVMLQTMLQRWGLESLIGDMREMLTAGDAADVVPIKLRETDSYKKRFKANLDRVKNGLSAYSEAEFLAAEDSLKTVVRRYVGAGTYDTRDNLDKWISNDVSPQELHERMSRYQEDVQRKSQVPIQRGDGSWTTVGEAWSAHGFTPADALKATFDPSVTEDTLRRQLGSYALGAEALAAYRDPNVLNRERLERLSDAGVTSEQARGAFGDIAAREDYEAFLARSAGETLTREEQESGELLGDKAASGKRKKVLDTDEARFAQNYMGGVNTLARPRSGGY